MNDHDGNGRVLTSLEGLSRRPGMIVFSPFSALLSK
jgi:hypothetical protein